MIVVENLSYTYQRNNDSVRTEALKQVNFSIQKGEWVAIVGHNGSGKSTLAKLLNGLLLAENGTIQINDLLVNEENIWSIRQQVGMVFQNPDNQFVGVTVEDDVAFGMENAGIVREEMLERVEEALNRVEMLPFKDKEPSRLSGGQKQRVAIASVLALRPSIIILDEATAMLDPKGRKQIITFIKALKEKLGLTVISITHDVEETAMAERVLVMNQGRLVFDGKPEQLFARSEDMKQYGLDRPFSEQVRQDLEQMGIQVPPYYMKQEELEDWLCRLCLNK